MSWNLTRPKLIANSSDPWKDELEELFHPTKSEIPLYLLDSDTSLRCLGFEFIHGKWGKIEDPTWLQIRDKYISEVKRFTKLDPSQHIQKILEYPRIYFSIGFEPLTFEELCGAKASLSASLASAQGWTLDNPQK